MSPTVTVLGLGGMGSALARALLRGGCNVTVWNRTPSRASPLLLNGARLAASAREAIALSELVIICVLDHRASHSLLESEGVAQGLSGKTIVDLTSATPDEMVSQQALVCSRGGRFISGGILALPAGIGRQDTLILYAGDAGALELHRAALTCLGGELEYMGPDPRAAVHAYSTLGLFLEATVALFLEASTMARSYGISMDAFYRLARTAQDLIHRRILDCTGRILGRQVGGEAMSIDLHLHLVHAIRAMFAKTGIPAAMTEGFMAHLQMASDCGYGSHDLSAIAKALHMRAQVQGH